MDSDDDLLDFASNQLFKKPKIENNNNNNNNNSFETNKIISSSSINTLNSPSPLLAQQLGSFNSNPSSTSFNNSNNKKFDDDIIFDNSNSSINQNKNSINNSNNNINNNNSQQDNTQEIQTEFDNPTLYISKIENNDYENWLNNNRNINNIQNSNNNNNQNKLNNNDLDFESVEDIINNKIYSLTNDDDDNNNNNNVNSELNNINNNDNNNNNNSNNNINNNNYTSNNINNSNNNNRKLPNWMKRNKDFNQYDEDAKLVEKLFEEKRNNKENQVLKTEDLKWLESLKGFKEVEQPITKGRIICFDLETSGFGSEDSIIEIGGVELIDGCRTGVVFQSYAKPKTQIHPKAEEIHHLNNYLLQYSPPIEVMLCSFMDWVGDSPLVAHNLAFDKRMLLQELIRYNIPFNNDHLCFCTMKYFRKVYMGLNYSLDSVSQKLKINKLLLRKTHGALVDAEILSIVYSHLLTVNPNNSINKIINNTILNNQLIQKNQNNNNNNINNNN